MNTAYSNIKEVVGSFLCEQGFVVTYIDENMVKLDNVYMSHDSYALEDDVILIMNHSITHAYENYSYASYRVKDGSTEKIPLPIERDILHQLDMIVKELYKYNWKGDNL